MPKEITYSDDPTFLAMPDGNEYPEGSPEAAEAEGQPGAKYRRRGVQVGWTKQHVEVGVASFDPSREMPSDGVFVSLDREGINRHIRNLRKARDAAFGADA